MYHVQGKPMSCSRTAAKILQGGDGIRETLVQKDGLQSFFQQMVVLSIPRLRDRKN